MVADQGEPATVAVIVPFTAPPVPSEDVLSEQEKRPKDRNKAKSVIARDLVFMLLVCQRFGQWVEVDVAPAKLQSHGSERKTKIAEFLLRSRLTFSE